jgi:ABC-type multidrug transport system fused ATPase/permease subunit
MSHGSDASATPASTVHRGGLWSNWSLLPRAMTYVRPYARQCTVSVGLTIMLALGAIAAPWPLAFVVDTVVHDRKPPGWLRALGGNDDRHLILLGAGGILILALISGALMVAYEYVTTKLDLHIVFDLRSDLFRHALRLSPSYYDDRNVAALMYRINNEADSLGKIVLFFPEFAQNGLTIAGMLYVAARIDAPLALLGLAVLPFVAFSTTFYANRIEQHVRRTRLLELATLGIVHEAIAMVRVIVAFGREAHEHRRFQEKGEEALTARVALTLREASFRLAFSLITVLGTAALLGFGAHQVVEGRLSAGELLVMLSYMAAVYEPLRVFTTTMTSLQQRLMALRAMLRLLDTPPEVVDRPDAARLQRVAGRITFENVTFSYPRRPPTLRSVSFDVQPGQAIALVGPTGAGKSTLAGLMPRHFEVSDGRVCIDGVDVRDVTIESLRSQFSIVPQEPLLFPGTIRDNIAYGRVGATQGEIEAAARDANAHDFISHLADGYDTVLGERGRKVSGGECQRIAIARAFLRDAPILILDEPTSSIDSRTEGVILDSLDRLMLGRTTIMIAHRLSTIRDADLILVIDNGLIVERGTHDELIDTGGLYFELWEAQQLKGQRAQAARLAAEHAGLPPLALVHSEGR